MRPEKILKSIARFIPNLITAFIRAIRPTHGNGPVDTIALIAALITTILDTTNIASLPPEVQTALYTLIAFIAGRNYPRTPYPTTPKTTFKLPKN